MSFLIAGLSPFSLSLSIQKWLQAIQTKKQLYLFHLSHDYFSIFPVLTDSFHVYSAHIPCPLIKKLYTVDVIKQQTAATRILVGFHFICCVNLIITLDIRFKVVMVVWWRWNERGQREGEGGRCDPSFRYNALCLGMMGVRLISPCRI